MLGALVDGKQYNVNVQPPNGTKIRLRLSCGRQDKLWVVRHVRAWAHRPVPKLIPWSTIQRVHVILWET